MWIKNGRIIINEDSLQFEIKKLEKELRTFFKEDPRFCMKDIGVFVEFDDDCWNDETHYFWKEINIWIVNYDKIIELSGELAGEKRFATAFLSCTTDGFEPQLVIKDGLPEFYYVFDMSSYGITNSDTWENNSNKITVEKIIVDEVLSKWEV